MLTIVETAPFIQWFDGLKDVKGRARILARIERILIAGHFGDCESLGEGVSELRIHFGPGYRIYFADADRRS